MRGEFVSLRLPRDDDLKLITRWSSDTAGVYSGGTPQMITEEMVRKSGMNLLVIVTHDGERVGAVNWNQLAYQSSYTIGSAIGVPGLWTHGYGVEANVLLLNYLFHSLNAHRVQLTVGMYNRHMVQIITHAGFTLEGVLRDYFFLDGSYYDAVVLSLLRDEFYELAAASDVGLAKDLIPQVEKEEARSLFLEHLERSSAHYLRKVFERE